MVEQSHLQGWGAVCDRAPTQGNVCSDPDILAKRWTDIVCSDSDILAKEMEHLNRVLHYNNSGWLTSGESLTNMTL